MGTICGTDCKECGFVQKCKGCEETCGHPFGGNCIAAEYIKQGGTEFFEDFKRQIISEFNLLGVPGMPEITELNCLCGFYVNLEYVLPSGEKMKFLNGQDIYLGNQVEPVFVEESESERCYGLLASMDFLLVCEYGCDGENPELLIYKRR